MARMTKAEKAAEKARREARYAEAARIVRLGVCPLCGAKLKRNLALTGWWQCSQYGDGHFKADQTKPSCFFQTFTE